MGESAVEESRQSLLRESDELRRKAAGLSEAAKQRARSQGDSLSNAEFLASRSRPVHTLRHHESVFVICLLLLYQTM